MKKKISTPAKLKTRKGNLCKKGYPGGLKTRKDDPCKRWIKANDYIQCQIFDFGATVGDSEG